MREHGCSRTRTYQREVTFKGPKLPRDGMGSVLGQISVQSQHIDFGGLVSLSDFESVCMRSCVSQTGMLYLWSSWH